jgi:hypothetical protein
MRKLILRTRNLINPLLALVCAALISFIALTACSKAPAYVPPSTSRSLPTSTETPTPTNPELELRVRDLETSISQLQTDNQRLLAENTQLRSDLSKVTSTLQTLYDLATSSTYANTRQLAPWVHSLPHLPPIPPGLTVSQINDAINNARNLRQLLVSLPSLPPPGWPPFLPFPQELIQLDKGRQTFVNLTNWMENLEDLPTFLATAGSLEDLRSHIEGYLGDVQNATFSATGLLEQVRDATSTR